MPMLVYWSVIFEAFISIVYSPYALRLIKTREKQNPNHRGLSQLPTDQVGQSSFRGAENRCVHRKFLGKYMGWTRWRQRYIQEEGMRRLPRWVYIICIYSSWKGYKLINLSSAEFISGEGVFAGVVRISCLWVVVWSQIGSKWPTIVLCWIDIFCQEHVNTEGHWY